MASQEDVADRFWAKVRKTPTCWLWTAGVDRKGYGRFRVGRKRVQAHVLAYELEHGPLPPGVKLDHVCEIRPCVRPSHLEPVSNRENVLRGCGPTAANARKTACVHGHPFDGENTYVRPDGLGRDCRTCQRERLREWKRALRRRMRLDAATPIGY